MSQTTYVIRKIAYFYNDEYHYEAPMGGIAGVYHDAQTAKKALTRLEVPEFRSLDFGDIEQTSFCGGPFDEERKRLHEYLQTTLGQSIFTQEEDWLYVELKTYLPQTLTDEQIMKIRDLSKIRFHELSAFDDEVHFYAIWLVTENQFLQAHRGKFGNAPYFFNSYDEALEAINSLCYLFEGVSIKGRLEELSYQPSLLRSLIEGTRSFNYNELDYTLKLIYPVEAKDLIALNVLLKEPIYGIRTIPLDEAAKIPHAPFEFE